MDEYGSVKNIHFRDMFDFLALYKVYFKNNFATNDIPQHFLQDTMKN